jgi:hypothetical protein
MAGMNHIVGEILLSGQTSSTSSIRANPCTAWNARSTPAAPVLSAAQLRYLQRCDPVAQRRVVWHPQCQAEQADDGANQLFGLTEYGTPLCLSECSATKLMQEFPQQLVDHLRRILLHPMGDTGQPLHGQLSCITLGPVETDWVQRHIPLAPNH